MDEPVYVPPCFPTPPPPAPEKRGLSSGTKLAAASAFLVAFVTMGFVGKAVVRSLVAGRGDRIATIDPYRLMSSEYKKSPSTFSRGVVLGAERGMRRNVPGGRITFDERADVTDLGSALRAVANYRGEVPTPDRGTATVEGQSRQYFHSNGAVVIETICFTTYSMCVGRDGLLDRTDRIVMEHLSDDTVDALLPPEGQCEAMSAPAAVGGKRMMLCRLEGDMVMTVMRMSLEETRAQFKRYADSGDAKGVSDDLQNGR
jgi:hypothetical protein